MQESPAITAVMKLTRGRVSAAAHPKNALVTRIESAPVFRSGNQEGHARGA